MNQFTVWVSGRPAPQGSKDGNGREASKYLPAWRAAIKREVFKQYKALGIKPGDLPLFRNAVGAEIVVHQDTAPTSKPDLDKLQRAIFDGLATDAHLLSDDALVVVVRARKVQAIDGRTGADITVWQENVEESDEH